jgi:ADP-ribosyl-[dinitrogen reductase] hydrolase
MQDTKDGQSYFGFVMSNPSHMKIKNQMLLMAINESKTKKARNFPIDLSRYQVIPDRRSLLTKDPEIRIGFMTKFITGTLPEDEDRAVGALLGLVCGDSQGVPWEFSPLNYQRSVNSPKPEQKFGLKRLQYSDDSSMALCITDSLLVNKGFHPIDIMLRFLAWWYFGLNNSFGFDPQRTQSSMRTSVGLGGNISLSFDQFCNTGCMYTNAGDSNTSGNGSIMRCAPIPIFYHCNFKQACQISRLCSRITHQGIEAQECSALLGYIITLSIQLSKDKKMLSPKQVLTGLPYEFKSFNKSVALLALSQQEDQHPDRDWNWKNPSFKYSPTRSKEQPCYVGSYCMDALAMALHIVYWSNSFQEAISRAAALGGDSDSVAAVVGQIAGALYGSKAIPLEWIREVERWANGTIAWKAWLLYKLGDQGACTLS